MNYRAAILIAYALVLSIVSGAILNFLQEYRKDGNRPRIMGPPDLLKVFAADEYRPEAERIRKFAIWVHLVGVIGLVAVIVWATN